MPENARVVFSGFSIRGLLPHVRQEEYVRKWNAVLSAAIVILLLVHMVAGAMQMTGMLQGGIAWLKVLARVMFCLIGLHMLIGIKLTADTLCLQKKAGTSYPKQNRLFRARRISGFALLALVASHLIALSGKMENGAFRLHEFGTAELVTQILLVVSLAVHILTNLTPMLIGLGIRSFRKFLPDLLLILSVLLLAAGAAFAVYFIRWNAM